MDQFLSEVAFWTEDLRKSAATITTEMKPTIRRKHLEKFHWLSNLLISLVAAVGGGTAAHYMLCIPPPWLSSNITIPTMICIWYLVHFSPFDVVYKLFNFLPITVIYLYLQCTMIHSHSNQIIVISFEMISRSRSIFSGIDLAAKHLPEGSVFGIILLGTVSGIGGLILANALIKILNTEYTTPSELTRPSWKLKSCFYATISYYVLLEVVKHPSVTQDAVKLGITLFLVFHAVVSTLVGEESTPPPFNIFEAVFFAVTRIRSRDEVQPTWTTKESKKEKKSNNKPTQKAT